MAEILKRTETVTRNFYRLDLSQEEVEVLVAVIGRVGGKSVGYRGVSQGIYDALISEVGDSGRPSLRTSGWIEFGDTK